MKQLLEDIRQRALAALDAADSRPLWRSFG